MAFRMPDGGSWDSGEYVAQGSGIHAAFDGAGTPYLSLGLGGSTYVAFHDGSAWQTELVEGKTSARTDIRKAPDGTIGVLHGIQSGGVGLGRK